MPAPGLPRAARDACASSLLDPPHSPAAPVLRAARHARRRHRQRRRLRRRLVRRPATPTARSAATGAPRPIWTDARFADLARVVRSGAVLAAVRSATAGMPVGEAAARAVHRRPLAVQPQRRRRRAGPARVAGLAADAAGRRDLLDPGRADRLRAAVGAGPAPAARRATLRPTRCAVVIDVAAAAPGSRLNLLLTDGEPIVGDRVGPRAVRPARRRGAVVVASEPYDDDPGWSDVPDRHAARRDRRRRDHPSALTDLPSRAATQRGATTDDDVTVDVHLHRPTTPPNALRADVRAGLTADPEVAAAQVVLRRPRQRAVRGDHPAAGVLPDPRRARDPARATPPRSPRSPAPTPWSSSARAPPRRPGCCSTRCGPAARCATSCRSTSARPRCAEAVAAIAGTTPASRCTASSATSPSTSAAAPARSPRLVAFLGGTIGNLVPGRAGRVPRRGPRASLAPGERLLLGTDLVKDPRGAGPAYDDAAGVTAAFNRNVLAVLNRELGADFDRRRLRPRRPLGRRARVDRDAAAGHAAA